LTLARYLVGLCLLTVGVGPVVLAAVEWRRRLLPDFVGPPGWLASGILSLGAVIVVSELLGSVGLFRLVPVTVSLAIAGFVALGVARRSGDADFDGSTRPHAPPMPRDHTGRLGVFAATGVTALVIGEWSTRVVDALRHGMAATDTLWYHLPVAAHFVQDGWTSHLHVYGREFITYFPASTELIHALGIMFLGTDVLSVSLNFGWLALALFSGWCIGRPFGVAPATLIGAAAVLATPEILADDAGSALNDIVGVALLLAAVALLAHAMRPTGKRPLRPVELACVGLAAGLALGTKYTLLVPVAALGVGVLAVGVRRQDLGRRAALGIAAVAVGGIYWYLRNLFAVGNPLPTLHIGFGPVELPTVEMGGTSSVSQYLFKGDAWSQNFLPGLGQAFGPAWWALSAAVAAGIALGVRFGPGRFVRMLAIVAGVSVLGFLFTPQILGPPRAALPQYFAINARYVAPGLALGLVVLPLAVTRFGDWFVRLVIVAYTCIVLGTQFGAGVWKREAPMFLPMVRESSSLVVGAAIGIGALVIGAALLAMRARSPWSGTPHRGISAVVTAVLVGALVATSFGVTQFYLHRRYRHTPPLPSIYRWAQGVHDQRIAAVNLLSSYPLFGKDLSNRVDYLAHGLADYSSPREHCAEWRRTVNEGRYSYVVVASYGFPFPTPNSRRSLVEQWTRTDPAAHLIMKEGSGARAWLYKIDGALDPQGCTLAARGRIGSP
jgi:hypothetical protein